MSDLQRLVGGVRGVVLEAGDAVAGQPAVVELEERAADGDARAAVVADQAGREPRAGVHVVAHDDDAAGQVVGDAQPLQRVHVVVDADRRRVDDRGRVHQAGPAHRHVHETARHRTRQESDTCNQQHPNADGNSRSAISKSVGKKCNGSPYLITERRVPELIPVLGSQPAGALSHKPGGGLPILSARPAVTVATLKRAATNFAAW